MDDIIKDFHDLTEIPSFQQMIPDKKYMGTAEYLDVLQMNIGRKCNLICKHCHVNAGPARTEEMSREVMDACSIQRAEDCNNRYYRRSTGDEPASGISDRRKQ
mgnify:CR=1 FL=1